MSNVPRLTKGLRVARGREISQESIKIFRERERETTQTWGTGMETEKEDVKGSHKKE